VIAEASLGRGQRRRVLHRLEGVALVPLVEGVHVHQEEAAPDDKKAGAKK